MRWKRWGRGHLKCSLRETQVCDLLGVGGLGGKFHDACVCLTLIGLQKTRSTLAGSKGPTLSQVGLVYLHQLAVCMTMCVY